MNSLVQNITAFLKFMIGGGASPAFGRLSPMALILTAAALILLTPFRSLPCSLFAFSADGRTVCGKNLDWHRPLPGLAVINVRGVEKRILPWKGSWPLPDNSPAVSWVSRYGSVTFTCYGRDFIAGGMNEAGLVVEEASAAGITSYPPDDGRPGVSCAQWIQYQLDSFAAVDEVLDHLDDLRPDGEGWHYLIAGRDGGCAIIEYLEGRPVVHRGDEAPICALTNTTYRQALSHIPMDIAFGGTLDIAAGDDSYGRFVRMAALMRDAQPVTGDRAAEQAFRILDQVRCLDTRRSVVYQAGSNRVLWRTMNNPDIRWLDLAALDVSDSAAVRILDIDAGGPGDVSALLEEFTFEANRAVVAAVKGFDGDEPAHTNELESRGLSLAEILDVIAGHPTAGDSPSECP